MYKDSEWIKKWRVPSTDGYSCYVVAVDEQGNFGCSCPSWKFRSPRKDCKHITKVKLCENLAVTSPER